MRNLLRVLMLAAILVTQAANALAWGDTGHMVIAQIAFDNLEGPVKARVNQLIQRVQLTNTTYEFVTAACYMDDTRSFPMFEPFKEWHFIDKRFIVSGPAHDEPPPLINAVSMIEHALRTLEDQHSSESAKAYALAHLIHLTGDVHQPLHCVSRFTTDHPDGDQGGNLFAISHAQRSKLHSYWDAAGGLFGFVDLKRPLTSDGRKRLGKFARDVTKANPASSLPDIDDLNPGKWADESFDLAKSEAYVNIAERGTPSDAYAASTKAVCSKRLATAGFRLSKLLKEALSHP